MIEHALSFLDTIVFYIAQNNIRSQRAVEKIGGRRIGIEEFPLLIRDQKEEYAYVIGMEEWKANN